MVPIRLENLSKTFATRRGVVEAVRDVSLLVEGGELFFLLGPSGCGKTTLLRMLAGFVEPSAGHIFFGDRDVTLTAPERRDAALVFQNYALWPHMTVEKNVAFAPEIRGVGRAARRQLVGELLETVRLTEKAQAKPMELSGGQQQRVALARALAAKPRCLLLDEPLSNLDAALRAAMRWEIRRIVKAAAATAVYVTHDQAEALAIADRIALMRDGRIVQVGTGPELYESPASRFVAEFLGQANFISGQSLGPAGEFLAIQTPAGKLLGRPSLGQSIPAGQAVVCCIRPETIRLLPAGQDSSTQTPGAQNVLPARLVEWTHLGETARFRVRLSDGAELAGAAMPGKARASQDDVLVYLAPTDVCVLAE